jgi:hypothetical protein
LQLRSPAIILLKIFIELHCTEQFRPQVGSFPSAASNGDWRVERPTTTRTQKRFRREKNGRRRKTIANVSTFQRFNIGGFALGCTGRLPHATKKKEKKKKGFV